MIKNLLLLSTSLFLSAQLMAQDLPLEVNLSNQKIDKQTFNDLSNSYEAFYSNKDVNIKGSGYKPFKRWQYHWSHYLMADGTISPANLLWQAWEQKKAMTKTNKLASDWQAVGPFDQSSKSGQGRINTVVVDPNQANTIYVGAPAGGLWRSTDAGVNWTPLTDDLPQIGVSGIAIDPNDSQIIYISTGDDDAADSYSIGVLKSIDGGASWNNTGLIHINSISSNEIVIDPTDSQRVWVATDSGIFLSVNGGDVWVRKQFGHIRDFKLKPGDPNTIYAVSSNQFFLSTDGGDTFTTSSVGLPSTSTIGRMRVEVSPASANRVYILSTRTASSNYAFQGVFISDDSGLNFTKTLENDDIFDSTQAWYDLAFSVSDINANNIFVGVLDIWKSTSRGVSFNKINDWTTVNATFTHADIHFMRYYNGVLYAGTDGGVYRSTDDGVSFTDLSKNLAISQFYKISVSKQASNKMAGGLQDNGGFSWSNNVWNNYHGGDGMDAASDPNDQNTFYGFTQFGGALSKTTDGGLTSTFVAGSPVSGNWVTPLVINKGGEIYAGYDQVYQLVDNVWTAVSSHTFISNLEALEIDPSNNNIIYTSRSTNLYKSTDRGKTFTTYNSTQTGIDGVNISSIEVHNSNSNIVWLTTTGNNNSSGPSSGHTGGGVYKSIDGGLTFSNISAGLPNESKFVIRHHPFSGDNSIYVGTALGVYHRNDTTNAWEVFSTNLPNVSVPDIEINPYDNTITAATYGRSVWQSAIPAVTQPAVDLDLIGLAPSSVKLIGCGGQITPSITVTNNGLNTLTSFTVNYNIDGGTEETYNYNGSLVSNASTTIDLNSIVTPGAGQHSVNATVTLANDANEFNNSSTSNFEVVENAQGVGQTTYTFGDLNPEATEDNGAWLVSDDNLWQIGSPTTTQLNGLVASGYITNPDANYPDLTTSYLTSPCYDLTILENPVLKFKMAFDLEQNWDVTYVEVSTDQGQSWNVLGTALDPNWYNSDRTAASSGNIDCFNCPGAQWTGTDNILKEYSYNLSAFNGESKILFRLTFVSDQSVTEEGVVVDDFKIDATAILSVNDFEDGEFLIYPNPSTDIFNIRRRNTAGEQMQVKVYDIMGRLIRQQANIKDASYKLRMKGVTQGLYFLHINIDNKRLVKKLVVK